MIIFITGISGAGKNTALRILEDNNFYCIDNAPLDLIPKIIEIARNSNISDIAFIIDPRIIFVSKKDPMKIKYFINKLIDKTLYLSKKNDIKIIFLDCNEENLIKRYNSNRRIHPLNRENLLEGIKLEKELLQKLKEKSHYVIDTSDLSPYDLSLKISEIILLKKMYIVKLISFGYKHGFISSDIVIDTRILRNPFYVSQLTNKNGSDPEVKEYLLSDPKTKEFIEKTIDYIDYIIASYLGNVKNFIEIGVGCTGGKHRSVFVAEYLGEHIRKKHQNTKVIIEHRDIHKN
ncbi:MAG: RNase adapter RapZ [Candidatus Calescibacterium sp.]|nr:RNase adapter RapZ [Candidatus Calescibacterium sp.]MCX7971635.1 RNase adapter RapZ [bacterium]MDW8195843.1 RNase adapter RapZ [Candidatus Calescibacterium sp.]